MPRLQGYHPIIPLVSTRGKGISKLKEAIDEHSNNLISTII
ncbi:MAG: hypothetical protein ACTS73_00855 [Arsenophonus sp. NEOnobi-MAG3]